MKEFKKDFGHSGWIDTPKRLIMDTCMNPGRKPLSRPFVRWNTCGSLIAGFFADKIGRRSTSILGCAIYIVGVVLQVIAQAWIC